MGRQPNIRLRHMRIFAEILRHGSLAAAANALHVTPAAVSKSLRELETEIGQRLLERSRKGVLPTPAGQRFHEHVTESLSSYGRAIASLTEVDAEMDHLSIGALPTAANSIVPMALQQMYSNTQRAHLNVVTGAYEDLAGKLRSRALDLIVGRITTRDNAGLSFEQLYEENIVAVTAPNHPLVSAGEFELDQIAGFPIIATPTGSTVRQSIDDFFFASGIRPKSLWIETPGDGFARRFTNLSDAIWFAPSGLVSYEIEAGHLASLPVRHATLRTVIGLTTRTNEALIGSALKFADILRFQASEFDDRGPGTSLD